MSQYRASTAPVLRPEDFASGRFIENPSTNDVLFGRGAAIIRWKGNVKFRQLVCERKSEYMATRSHAKKNEIARQIMDEIQNGRQGRFLVKMSPPTDDAQAGYSSVWEVADDMLALEKVKQTLRDKQGDPSPPRQHLEVDRKRRATAANVPEQESQLTAFSTTGHSTNIGDIHPHPPCRLDHALLSLSPPPGGLPVDSSLWRRLENDCTPVQSQSQQEFVLFHQLRLAHAQDNLRLAQAQQDNLRLAQAQQDQLRLAQDQNEQDQLRRQLLGSSNDRSSSHLVVQPSVSATGWPRLSNIIGQPSAVVSQHHLNDDTSSRGLLAHHVAALGNNYSSSSSHTNHNPTREIQMQMMMESIKRRRLQLLQEMVAAQHEQLLVATQRRSRGQALDEMTSSSAHGLLSHQNFNNDNDISSRIQIGQQQQQQQQQAQQLWNLHQPQQQQQLNRGGQPSRFGRTELTLLQHGLFGSQQQRQQPQPCLPWERVALTRQHEDQTVVGLSSSSSLPPQDLARTVPSSSTGGGIALGDVLVRQLEEQGGTYGTFTSSVSSSSSSSST